MKHWIVALALAAPAAVAQLAPAPPSTPASTPDPTPLQAAPAVLEKIVEAETPDLATLAAGVFDRLLALLEEIPQRWDSLPPPRISYSGKGPREVLAESSEEQNQTALRFISRLALAPLEARPELIRRWLEEHPPTEVDVWLPMQLAEAERLKSRQESALTLEAWLQWAEALGRKDALLWAAGDALYELSIRRSFRILEGIGKMWTNLAAVPEASCAQAHLGLRHADILGSLDKDQEAIPYYHRARELCVSDLIEQGRAWHGEGIALQQTDDHDGALRAYHQARDLFGAAGDQGGIGSSWLSEGHLRLIEGDTDGSLEACRTARELFEAAGDRWRQALSWSLEADALHWKANYDAALEALRTARILFEQVGDPRWQAETWHSQAISLNHKGDTDAALEALRQARTLFEQVEDPKNQANTWWFQALFLGPQDNDATLKALRQARTLFEAAGSLSGQADTWWGEGMVLGVLGDTDGALNALRQARQLSERIEDPSRQADIWFAEGSQLIKSDLRGALRAFRQAATLYQVAEAALGQVNSLNIEAGILRLLGDEDGTLRACDQMRQVAKTIAEPLVKNSVRESEASCRSKLDDKEGALQIYRDLRSLAEADENQREQGTTWLAEAAILLQMGDADGALQAYRHARIHFEEIGDERQQGNTWTGEARVLSHLGDHNGALEAYRRARSLFEVDGFRLLLESAWTSEARALLALGQSEHAVEAAQQAMKLATEAKDKEPMFDALMVLAEANRRLGRLDQAIEHVECAIPLLNDWGRGYTDTQRVHFQDAIQPAHDLLISTSWQSGRPLQALERAEQARARVLLDLLISGYARQESEGDYDLTEKRLRLEVELAEIDRRLRQPISPEEREELVRRQREADRELEWLHFDSLYTAELSRTGDPSLEPEDLGEVADPRKPSPPTFSDRLPEAIREMARQVGPILLYYVAEEQSFAFLIRPELEEPVARRLELPRARLRQQAGDLADALANPNFEAQAEPLARELWRELLEPFAEHLPEAGPLTLVPHGPLHQIPFEALIDAEGRRLFERFDIAVAPSISTLEHLRTLHRPASADDRFLALAGGAGLTLPAAEIRAIASLFDPKQAAEFEPGLTSFRTYEKLAPHIRHLFIATQALLTEGDRRRTYLEIEPSDDHDSRLTAAEIATLPIDAELVTLAACDTAGGEALLSDERLDLSRAFLIAGAAAVLATRWKVPEDFRTSRFLLDFYREYRQGGPEGQGLRKDQALNAARRLSRERGDPARIWAAWVLIGDAR